MTSALEAYGDLDDAFLKTRLDQPASQYSPRRLTGRAYSVGYAAVFALRPRLQ